MGLYSEIQADLRAHGIILYMEEISDSSLASVKEVDA